MSETSVPRGSRSKLVYLLAASHSGSTLLAFLLGGHPDVCTVGELKVTSLGDPTRYRCSCGELITVCAFWQRVSAAMARRGLQFEVTHARTDVRSVGGPLARRLLKPLHRGAVLEAARDLALALTPGWRGGLRHLQDVNAALVESLGEVTGRGVVVDSSKVALRLKYLLRNRRLDVRVVRLVRDGRAVANTYMDPARFADAQDPHLREGGQGGDRAWQRISMRSAAHEWRRSNEEAAAAIAGLPRDRVCEVRYEEVCADPQGTLARVFTFMGVDPARGAAQLKSFEHHVIGNGMRFDTTTEVRLDERWRTSLGPAELQDFDAEAGALNRQFGYR